MCLKDASGTQGGVQQGGQDSNDFVVPMRREHSNYNSSECRCIRYFSQFVKSLAPLFLFFYGFSVVHFGQSFYAYDCHDLSVATLLLACILSSKTLNRDAGALTCCPPARSAIQ